MPAMVDGMIAGVPAIKNTAKIEPTSPSPAKKASDDWVGHTVNGMMYVGGGMISEGEIMKLSGWRTRAMFDRYNIIDEADLAQAVAKRFNGKQAANTPSTNPGVSSEVVVQQHSPE